MQRFLLLMFLFLSAHVSLAQHPGLISGNILDEKQKALENASVRLVRMDDSLQVTGMVTDKNGFFSFSNIAFGYYRLRVSHTGMQLVTIDSIHFRADRYDFNMNDIVLHPASAGMAEVIIYAEKPLIQSRDGNITFNAGESALAAGSNASELLTNVPLVTKDPDGKVLVRGKEPKILIDDKPVELNQQQLQDFLESMPGSSIEKIEVMTNPPPQYANEQGGVINIVTKKGTVGMNGRVSVYAGTRGDAGINGSFSYRKQGFSIAVNAGAGHNDFQGNGYSVRQNIYDDSTSYFNTTNQHNNQNLRPNFRANVNYDISKLHALNFTAHLNANQFDNANNIENRNINRFDELYRLRDRQISSDGNSRNMNLNFSYTMKTKRAGETLRAITAWNRSRSSNTRDFFEQFLNPDLTPSGNDSTQQQINRNHTDGYSVRVNYDRPMLNNKTVVSAGTFYNHSRSDIAANAYYQQKLDGKWTVLEPLTNDFRFYQDVFNVRASVKQVLSEKFSITAGASAEHTLFEFDLTRSPDTSNRYWSLLPFATLNKSWEDKLNLTFSYRRTIRRPGIGELNPTIDFSDPYNIRFGNPGLLPSVADNFDLVVGRQRKSFYINLGTGYNHVQDIFSSIRTRLNNDTTQVTWQNISGRKEYEISTWSGYTLSKKSRINASASYTYNEYSDFDKTKRKFRDGGSFTSNLNANYTIRDLYTATGSFTYNRFANPQGSVRSTLSMNIGLQAKLLEKKMTVTLNIIDPFVEQQNRSYTYGNNFVLENYRMTETRNFRLSVAYALSKTTKKTSKKTEKAIKDKLPAGSNGKTGSQP